MHGRTTACSAFRRSEHLRLELFSAVIEGWLPQHGPAMDTPSGSDLDGGGTRAMLASRRANHCIFRTYSIITSSAELAHEKAQAGRRQTGEGGRSTRTSATPTSAPAPTAPVATGHAATRAIRALRSRRIPWTAL